jgi:flagellar basal-body rod modification protein FlgD
MTMPVTSADSSNNTPIGDTTTSTAQDTGTASLLQPNTFLDLLVDELKYQNPLDPTNSSDFMNQIAELSQVEQLQTVSSSSQISEAAGLIGQSVSGTDANGSQISGTVTGVTNGTNGPTLDVGGDSMALASVQQIGAAASS